MPRSSSGKETPQPTTRMPRASSSARQFIPTSPRPPSGTMRSSPSEGGRISGSSPEALLDIQNRVNRYRDEAEGKRHEPREKDLAGGGLRPGAPGVHLRGRSERAGVRSRAPGRSGERAAS